MRRCGPVCALDSQLTAAVVVMGASLAGAPVSTTHVVTSSILGIGASEHPRAVRWQTAQSIAVTWLITLNMFKRREIYRHRSKAADRMAVCADTLQHMAVKMG